MNPRPGREPPVQHRPAPPEVEAFVGLLRAEDRLRGEVSALLKAHGISQAQYNVLRILRGAEGEWLTCQGVGERMINRVPDITRLLDRLEQAGLVERRRSPEDRRVVLVGLRPPGKELLARLDDPVRELHRRQFRGFTRAELRQLTGLLNRLGRPGS